ncbi:diacylglycerol kinase [Solitalea sp. MAHUQ-68]|uniref:Diacylglycerol kinase n=1 Tax=Solitalea agri TaxID=2953739 RepID=A0A9X2F2Y7_9SPHI|nr:diacylglycerol kinase family protein [Solitalea agri]MCO4293759.1 diacylglycerol kinase [Solitalea agri]
MKSVLFIVNPFSGGIDKSALLDSIESFAQEHHYRYSIYKTTGSADLEQVKELIAELNPAVIAVAGGDGTILTAVNAVFGTPTSIVIIPVGSANGMAKELNVPMDINKALALIESGKDLLIDLLDINGKICVHLADVGLNAKVVKRFEQDPNRGLWIYGKYVFRELFQLRINRFSIQLPERKIRRFAVSMIFANASKYGTGAVINPVGSLTDGKFELCIIRQFPFWQFFVLAYKAFFGKFSDSEYVEIISTSQVTVKASRKTLLQADGEIIGKVSTIVIKVLPQSVSFLVSSV